MFHRLVPAVTRYVHGCVVYTGLELTTMETRPSGYFAGM